MIISLELTCFRKHESLKVNFTQGLNVIRGPNEIGKTTLIEAFLYAGGGVKSLRESLAKTVTWGRKESELKVVAETRFSGVHYTFSRSKAGAECNWVDAEGKPQKVAGQAEVTAKFAELLGADAKTASLLMLASASGLRGALDDGPTAVSGLMGRLADFDVIDQIIEAAATRFTLGSAVPLQERLKAAEDDVNRYSVALIGVDPVPELQAQIDERQAHLEPLVKLADEVLQPAIVTADDKVQHAKELRQQQIRLEGSIRTARTRLADEQQRLKDAEAKAAAKPDNDLMEKLRREIADASVKQRELDAYAIFKRIPVYPEVHWEGTKEGFDAERAKVAAERDEIKGKRVKLDGEVAALLRGKITSGKCPTCGHAARSDEHVAQHNAEIDRQVRELQAQALPLAAREVELNSDLSDFDKLVMTARPFEEAAAKLHEWVEIAPALWPPSVSWRGPAPTESVSSAALKSQLSQLESQATAAAQAQGRCEAYRASIAQIEKDLADLEEGFAKLVVPDLQPLVDAYDEAYRVYAEANVGIRAVKDTIAALTSERDAAAAARREAQGRLDAARARVAELEQDLERLEFHNGLVAKLKKLKPMITDHLWNTVLAAVSNFFTSLRGEQSVVTKDHEGFKVNGRGIDGLSESTLDVLALAIRVALTKTFIPHASFISLDEPAKGCDSVRTSSLLGFLASIGLQQTVLASHDEQSEAVADNVILLGA